MTSYLWGNHTEDELMQVASHFNQNIKNLN